MKNPSVPLLVACLAVPALAQTNGTFVLTSSNTVSPSSPITTVGIWATLLDPGAQFVFWGADYDLTAGDGAFSNPVNMLIGPGSSTGVIAGNVISGAINGQFHLPPTFPGLLDNPILLAAYDWTTTDFTPRAVDLHTSNTNIFLVFSPVTGEIVALFPDEFKPGSGVINIVPAPAAWFALALPLVAGRRRRY